MKRQVLACSLLVVLAAQINVSPFGSDFRISVAVVLLPLFALIFGKYPLLPVAGVSALGVFASRMLWSLLEHGVPNAAGYWPEMVFYLVYGALLYLYLRRTGFQTQGRGRFLVLIALDYAANLAETFCRGGDMATVRVQASLLLVAAIRTALVWCFQTALDYQNLYLLKREHAERYQKLVLLISRLRGELVWMEKSAAAIENTMNTAYQLYQQLQDEPAGEQALTIAKDIHEIKKEYNLILRGINEALVTDLEDEAMSFRELWQILFDNLRLSAQHSGLTVDWDVRIETDFSTHKQYQLLSILRNLLDNAMEAAEGDRTEISFTAAEAEGSILLTVSNRGKPIRPENLERIFDPGFSTKINYATGQVSRGVGLSLVRDLVEELQGSIRAESRDGRTCFFITLPKSALEG